MIEFLISELLALVLEESIDSTLSKRKLPKVIRYFILLFILLFYIFVIGLIIFVGIKSLKDNLIGGFLIILFGILIVILAIIRFRKEYISKKNNS